MATRSGKTYQEPKRSRKRAMVKDTSSTTINGVETDDKLNVTTNDRELRSRHSSVKDSTFDKSDTSTTTCINNSTESNWTVSDLSCKKNKKLPNVNTSLNSSITFVGNGSNQRKVKSNFNTSNRSNKQLTKKKSEAATLNETDQKLHNKDIGDKAFEQEGINATGLKKNTRQNDENDSSEINEIDLEKGVENDLNSMNVAKVLKNKKKKKSKARQKKKLKDGGVPDKEELPDDVKVTHLRLDNNDAIGKYVRNSVNIGNKIDVLEELDPNSFQASCENVHSKKASSRKASLQKELNKKAFNTSFEILQNKNASASTLNAQKEIVSNSPNGIVHIEKTGKRKANVEKDSDQYSLKTGSEILQNEKTGIKDTTFEIEDDIINTTYDKNEEMDRTFNKDLTYDSTDVSRVNLKRNPSTNTTPNVKDKSNHIFKKESSISYDSLKKSQERSSIRNISFDKKNKPMHNVSNGIIEKAKNVLTNPATKIMFLRRQTMDLITSPKPKLDTDDSKRKSRRLSEASVVKLNTTFDKENKTNSKSSLISSDNSSISQVSITSDESSENIVNTTPLLIETSVDESQVKDSPLVDQVDIIKPQTPLKREGTFTKEIPTVHLESPPTPNKYETVITPAAGCTPYHVSKSSHKKPMLNVTRSIEKRLSIDPGHRLTKVMFCSPVDHPSIVVAEKRKIIKSNLKGSNKSFVFDEHASASRPARKRSYTQNDADDVRTKRSRLAEDIQQSVDRLSRSRTASTATKLGETTPKKSNPPYRSKSETKPARTHLPNFAALHQKQFDKMESLGECQERKAKRARQMLTPTRPIAIGSESQKKVAKETVKPKDKIETPLKKLPALDSTRPGFTRFGFKLNMNVNPFSIPARSEKQDNVNDRDSKDDKLCFGKPKPSLPSLKGTTVSRRDVAKQTVMREKSILEKRRVNRSENRTIIKGVRTNRRFELQMKHRNVVDV